MFSGFELQSPSTSGFSSSTSDFCCCLLVQPATYLTAPDLPTYLVNITRLLAVLCLRRTSLAQPYTLEKHHSYPGGKMRTFTTLISLVVAYAAIANAQGLYVDTRGRARCTLPNGSYCGSDGLLIRCDGTFALAGLNCNDVSSLLHTPSYLG